MTKTGIKNPGKSCADCIHHECRTGCMRTPKDICRGQCTLKKISKKCDASGKRCEDFKQIDWRNYYGN